ncbi:MAG: D-alanine--D-alanine ligase family protein [Peptoniphilaceae bacterium]|nr:D-alanine--D-alanine ligase [Peptoniphilaceae bacterium]MDD7383872.1 D-alanine--D-alanine ligase [Peptoniphilaceae bacterium]MDY3738013.1 D-alanine--D-alanine ligase family protein [Peptoniphilaceae bacterium]
MKKIYLLCGSPSTEHDISLRSAKNICENLNKEKYELKIVYIDKRGHFSKPFNFENIKSEFDLVRKTDDDFSKSIFDFLNDVNDRENSLVIPCVHGNFGEDGKLQGFLDICGIKYIGNGVLSSAICMDKETSNDIFQLHNIKQARYMTCTSSSLDEKFLDECIEYIKFPMIVKPSANGSSIGVNKALNREDLKKYINEALKYDKKALIEELIEAQEIEISVVGDINPKTSKPGAYISNHTFLDYDAKYFDKETIEKVPYEMNSEDETKAREIAKKAYIACHCEGFARVDIFYKKESHEFFINEINTFPGLTPSSFFARLWEKTYDVNFEKFLDELIEEKL